ncbi:MAG: AAA family ATPase [Actinomycetales bacterium]|nr:AAA family ATPase [Actinomycetales bacterium]
MAPVLVLIGSPGAGKSSVGRRVAQRLKVPFADSDALIEQAAGMSVSDIFVTEGEDAFRELEEATIADALEAAEGVLSLGGGAVMRDATRDRLRGLRVVWLKVSLSDAASRVGMNQARPLLLGNVRGTLSALMEKRNPVYEEVATAMVDTSGRPLRAVVDDVVKVVRHG